MPAQSTRLPRAATLSRRVKRGYAAALSYTLNEKSMFYLIYFIHVIYVAPPRRKIINTAPIFWALPIRSWTSILLHWEIRHPGASGKLRVPKVASVC